MKLSRLNAFLLRLTVTLILFLVLRYLLVANWYPGGLMQADGGWQGIRILIGVDLVLGPLLVLLLFIPGKRGLKFDMAVIGVLQVAAIVVGSFIIYQQRPYAIVYSEGYFKPLTEEQFFSGGDNTVLLSQLTGAPPYYIYSDLPKDNDKLAQLRGQALAGRRPLYLFAEYYRPFTPVAINDISQQAYRSEVLLQQLDENDTRSRRQIETYQQQGNTLFVNLRSRYKNSIVVFDTRRYSIVDSLAIDPGNRHF